MDAFVEVIGVPNFAIAQIANRSCCSPDSAAFPYRFCFPRLTLLSLFACGNASRARLQTLAASSLPSRMALRSID
eukprot:4863967-Pleurochrysis_carterae.AAC.1